MEALETIWELIQIGVFLRDPASWAGFTLAELVCFLPFTYFGRFYMGLGTASLPDGLAYFFGFAWTGVTVLGVLLAYHCELYYNPHYADPFQASIWIALTFGGFIFWGIIGDRAKQLAMRKTIPEVMAIAETVVEKNGNSMTTEVLAAIWLLGNNLPTFRDKNMPKRDQWLARWWFIAYGFCRHSRWVPFLLTVVGAILMVGFGKPHTATCGMWLLAGQGGIVLLYAIARDHVRRIWSMSRSPSLDPTLPF